MKHLTLILLAVSLAACGNLRKTTHTETASIDSTLDQRSTELVTRTSTIDTTVTLPADTLTVARPIIELTDTGVLFFEDANQSIELAYDKPTKTIRAKAIVKPQTVPVYKTETIVEHREEVVQAESHTEVAKSDVHVSRWQWPWWVWLIPIAGLVYLVYRARRFIPL